MAGDRYFGFEVPRWDTTGAKNYLMQVSVLSLLEQSGAEGQIPPDYCDLASLYWPVVNRKVFTILEFGVGWSTLVLAAAIRRNWEALEELHERPAIGNHTPFMLFSADTSKHWLSNVRRLIADDIKRFVKLVYSDVHVGQFSGQMCCFYKSLPDVVPDFIYLDGPDTSAVQGDINGLSWKNPDRTPLAADLLIMEPTLLPGTCVVIDGQTNNARFPHGNLQRPWGSWHDEEGELTIMELQEPPLERINYRTLEFCLGADYRARL
jgi:hypothetical protein